MKRFYMVIRLKRLMLYGFMMLLLFLLITQSNQVIEAIQNALLLCYKTVIPSLFPFFVISGLLTGGTFIKKIAKWLSPLMKPLFRICGAGALPLAIGIISGYPMGAKMTAELYSRGALSKQEATRLLPFTNNSGPLFIIGAVGVGMLRSTELGVFLYIIHVLSALLVGLCFRYYKGGNTLDGCPSSSFHHAPTPGFSEIMSSSVNTMLLICGFIVFFSAVSACLSPILNRFGKASLYIESILEVTNGAYLITQAGFPLTISICLLSAIVGFGGICVMLQVMGIIVPVGLPLKSYVLGKILQGVISAILSFCLYPLLLERNLTVFAPTLPISRQPLSHLSYISALILLWIFMYCLSKLKRWLRTVKK